MTRGTIRRAFAAFAAGLLALAQPAYAQLKPLDVEHDFNGVDVLSGQIQTRPPEISVPGAGHLSFQKIQDLMPIMNGTIVANSPDGSASYDLNNGSLSSEHFDCDDNAGCVSKKKNGSTLTALPVSKQFFYIQGGTATQITYDLQNYSQGPLVGGTGFSFYPSSITYANGEKLTFTYDTYTGGGGVGTTGYKYRRPNTITSNLGYRLTFTYQAPWMQSGWTAIAQATMYGPGDVIVGQLTYSGNSITDLAGRTFTCTNCSNTLGSQSTSSGTTLRLPGESVDTLAVADANCLSTGFRNVASVTGDGVTYNYAFTPTSSTCQYLQRVVITGPLSFSRTVNMTSGFNIRPRVTSIVDSLNRTTSYQYDNSLRVIKITYPETNSANVVYDLFGNITESRLKAKTGSGLADIVETASFNAPVGCEGVLCYKPVWTKDAKAQQTDYTWSSAHGGLLTKLEPADASGFRRKTINEYLVVQGAPTRVLRERICATNSAGVAQTCGTAQEQVREFTYWGSTMLPLTETRKDGTGGQARTTSFTYDPAGRMLTSDGPLSGTDDASYFRYDTVGRRTWEIGPKGANGYRTATRTSWRTADDQPLTVEKGYVVNPDETVLTVLNTEYSTYDSRRLLTKKRLADGATDVAVTQMSYDARNRNLCSTVRMNPAVWGSLPTDACVLGTSGTSGADRVTRTGYDAESRVTLIEKAVGTPRQQNYVAYTYTPNGKREYITDANGNKAKYQYDGFDRQTHWFFPSKTTVGTVSTTDFEQYGYDPNGNRTSLRKRDGRSLTFAYDGMNRMTSKLVPDGCAPIQVGPCTPASATRDVFYAYDIFGRQLTAKYDSQAGADGLTSAYDIFGNLISSTISMGGFTKTLAAQYDIADRRTQLTHPDGQAFTYAYDAADRLTGVYEGVGTAVSLDTFAYNVQGLVSARTERLGSSVTYGYDNIGRLTSMGDTFVGGTGNVARTFAYTPSSQLSQQTRDNDAYAWNGHADVERLYAVNGLNQYTTVGAASPTYDANGNLIGDGTTTYIYDAENRLVSASNGTTLTYDPMGRLWQVVKASANTRFLTDGDAMVAEYDGADAMTARYVHGSNSAADDPLVWYQGSTTRWLHADHLGSIVGISDGAGGSPSINSYDEYGVPAAINIGRYQFTGQVWLSELGSSACPGGGLYYYKARLYSPCLGRFLQTDPIGYEDQINLYAYVANDPVNGVDPMGLAEVPLCPSGDPACTRPAEVQAPLSASERAENDRIQGVEQGGSLGGVIASGIANEIYDSIANMGPADTIDNAATSAQIGAAGEAAVAKELLANGYVVVDSHVTIQTAAGVRVADHMVADSSGGHLLVEVKANSAERSFSQARKDFVIQEHGGNVLSRSGVVPYGSRIQVPTIVVKVTVPR